MKKRRKRKSKGKVCVNGAESINEDLSFDLKYRPRTLDEMIGNESLVEQLQGRINDKEFIAKTILLQGPSGCGKTTLARIMAKKIVQGGTVKEYNISNTRGIDHARAIIQETRFVPIRGRAKVIILNEVHGATKDFQNSMLETLEEPPKGFGFILCTTEPEKLLPTIRNRARKYTVKPLSRKEIINLCTAVCVHEDLEHIIESEAKPIIKIAKVANGCPREALVLLDSIKHLEEDDELEEAVSSITGIETYAKELCVALLDGISWKKMGPMLKTYHEDPERTRYAILGYMTAVLTGSDNSRAAEILELFCDSFMYSGKAGLVLACYYASKIGKG